LFCTIEQVAFLFFDLTDKAYNCKLFVLLSLINTLFRTTLKAPVLTIASTIPAIDGKHGHGHDLIAGKR